MANCVFCNCELTGRQTKYCSAKECRTKKSRQDFTKHYWAHRGENRERYDRWYEAHCERSRARRIPK